MSTPAAGWYVDSTDPSLVRWWDGAAWSDHTQPNPDAPATAPTSAPVEAVVATPVPTASVPLVPSAPYVPPPFADPPPPAPVAAPVATPVPAALNYPPPAFGSPAFAEPSASPTPAAAPGPRRTGSSLPISEPVRLTPPASGAIPVAGFPGFDDPLPTATPAATPTTTLPPSTTPPPLAVPSQPAPDAPAAGGARPGSSTVTPLATATPMPASASTPWTSSTSFAQPTGSVDLASVDYEPMTRSWGSKRPVGATRAVTGVTTGGAWMLALSPVLHLGLAALGWLLTDGGASTNTPYVSGGLGIVALLWVVLGTITDYRRLGALGHEFRPSPAWIVLGPLFYLLVRAVHVYRTTRSGTAPTWVYVVLAIVVSATVSALTLLQPRDATTAELRTVESTLTSELQGEGIDYTVLCPSQATFAVGASFVCTAYDDVGPASLIRVTWSSLTGDFTHAFESSPVITG
ncbi:DUF2510 domain-containing protein [Microcella humidisoli]|uniref:DUF2510 domain-containing protein n=1 Tax=Microcella humidisoli TaxID=2963406 RepID=A0ABY5FXU0_9MICO|nr:DUF2510 domain-containing protein [Microcella humidisoli]UTT62571.1 DUF2510 domain-containing protein [Microcella humidisoli]